MSHWVENVKLGVGGSIWFLLLSHKHCLLSNSTWISNLFLLWGQHLPQPPQSWGPIVHCVPRPPCRSLTKGLSLAFVAKPLFLSGKSVEWASWNSVQKHLLSLTQGVCISSQCGKWGQNISNHWETIPLLTIRKSQMWFSLCHMCLPHPKYLEISRQARELYFFSFSRISWAGAPTCPHALLLAVIPSTSPGWQVLGLELDSPTHLLNPCLGYPTTCAASSTPWPRTTLLCLCLCWSPFTSTHKPSIPPFLCLPG